MPFRFGPWALALVLAILCAGAIGGVWYIRSVAQPSAASMQEHLPVDSYAVIGIDFAALRKANVLNSVLPEASSPEEQDYRNFVSLTGFDYRSDLDYVLIGLKEKNQYIMANGRFDWAAIMKYAELHDGVCTFGFCRMKSSTKDRHISYFAQRNNVIAIGVGGNEWVANDLEREYQWTTEDTAPEGIPVWILFRPQIFQNPELLPAVFHPWVELLNGASRASFTVVSVPHGFNLRMKLECTGNGTALRVQERLEKATSALNGKMVEDDQPIDGKSIPAVLASGKFEVTNSNVSGTWFISRDLIDLIVGGGL